LFRDKLRRARLTEKQREAESEKQMSETSDARRAADAAEAEATQVRTHTRSQCILAKPSP